ncbi:MAG: prephenate dehydrogenase/arogenate dehydrogenase family protein [Myxococcales bacterium]|nr:MAG: prephenate dehydrogenase/arogenate dehydrogenase family protein [Myxococcales bacterium]
MDIGIIGYGRFAQVLASILSPEHRLFIYEPKGSSVLPPAGSSFVSEEQALAQAVIFYAVPINALEGVLAKHAPVFRKDGKSRLVLDVLSVKLHAKQVFERHLPSSVKAILLHPMFGPDSVREQGFNDLPMVMDRFCASEQQVNYWTGFFQGKGLHVIAMSAEEHDRKAAWSQGVTHFIGRVLDEMKLAATDIDTLGAKRLLEIRDQVCNDSWELFTDLQTKNPYTIDMRVALGKAVDRIYNSLCLIACFKNAGR